MTAIYGSVLTAAGQALYTAAVASGIPVQLTAMAIDDGNGNPIPKPDPANPPMAMIHEVWRNYLSAVVVDASDSTLMWAELIVPPTVGGWTIRGLGLFTVDGTLFAYANFPDSYKPVIGDGSSRDLVLQFALKIANTSAVTIMVDPNIVGATRAWVLATITPAYLFPGGTTHQVLRKKSNTSGDTEWADPTAALNIIVDAVKEIQAAAAGQDTFTLALTTTVGIAVYIEGLREFDFTVLDSTHIQLSRQLGAGTRVLFVQNAPNEPIAVRRIAAGYSYFLGQL